MNKGTLYTLSEAQRATGENRNLITFLVNQHKIPCRKVGKARVIDGAGLKALRAAIATYKANSELSNVGA